MYGTKALLLKEGRLYKFGDIEGIMTRENLKAVYGVDVYDWMNKLSQSGF